MDPVLCGLLVLLWIFVVYKLVDHVVHRSRICSCSVKRWHIFITGCDTGFGHELAKRLDSLGCHVYAGCYTEKGETELKKICSERLYSVPLDVTNRDSVTRAFELISKKLESAGTGLWAVVNNAGTLNTIVPADWLTVDDYRRQCDINLFGLIDITMTFLPLVKKTQGRVVIMSSNYALVSNPIFAPYSVSKFGIEAFTDALRHSLKPFGCKVSLIEPGGFKTSLTTTDSIQTAIDQCWRKCSLETQEQYTTEYTERFKKLQLQGVERLPTDFSPVIDAYEHALVAKYPRPRYLVGYDAVLMAVLAKLPEFIGDLILMRRLQLPKLRVS